MQHKEVVEDVRHWLTAFVIELNLCPFAKRELIRDRVRFAPSDANSGESLLIHLLAEMRLLETNSEIETTLLIHPEVLQDFDDFNQFLDLVDALIEQEGYTGVFQVASFHPQYQFADTAGDDAENYSNRSPYPILHILREASVARKISVYPDIDAVPKRNIELLRSLGVEKLEAMLLRNP